MKHSIKILETEMETPDVKRFVTEKPQGYEFRPGQATEIELLVDELKGEARPFSFTNRTDDQHLEFLIKIYSDRDGVTEALMEHRAGDQLVIGDPFGAIAYEGPGEFIAGGAGITPFISILRRLREDEALEGNTLHFANKTESDIILCDELRQMLGNKAHFVLSREAADGCQTGRIDQEYLRGQLDNLDQYFYICGPPPMVENTLRVLKILGVNKEQIVTEDGF